VPSSAQSGDEPTLDGLDLGLVHGGVSAAWLGHVFGHDKNTIKKKLAQCEIAGKNRGTPLYRIKDAAAWLVPPKVDIMTYIKGLRPQDLPPVLNDAYWSAMRKRQVVLKEAGDTWATEDVLSVFGTAAIRIKSTVQLWVDELERVHGLSDEQRRILVQMSDGLLEDVHEIFVTAPSQKRTRSTLSEHDEESVPAAVEVPERDDLI
jgi:hypothetical protein